MAGAHRVALVAVLSLFCGFALLETLSRPFAAIALTAAGACAFLAWTLSGIPRAVAYNLGVVFLGLGILEGYALYDAQRTDCDPELSDPHDILGYAPLPDRHVSCRKTQRGETIYDTVYSLDKSGWRVAPPRGADDPVGCVLFFGGSFTFGQGVGDDEAMPYRVGLETEGRYQIYNFGFKGYGPHQMLSALESGWVEQQISCVATHAIYQAIPSHVQRVVGLTSWGSHDPMYRLNAQGEVIRRGHFDDAQSDFRKFVERRLGRFTLVTNLRHARISIEAWHTELFHEIVSASQRAFRRRFAGAQFHVLVWDLGAKKTFLDGLVSRGLEVHRVTRILPGYPSGQAGYHLHPRDRHPNARAHREIAQYVAHKLLLPTEGNAEKNPSPAPALP